MPNDARGDVLKLWLYAALSVALGAWISPLLYNAGKALAEISSNKVTNGVIEQIAGICRAADFSKFYEAGILLAACLLFFPWMEWAHARCADAFLGIREPWKTRLTDNASTTTLSQRLLANLRGPWLACAGFFLMAGLLIAPGIALMFARHSMHTPAGGLCSMALHILAALIIPATVMEIFFRGIVMGVFLRAMRPTAAIGMSAAFFAIVLSLIAPAGLNVADPEAAGIGFELLGKSIVRFADWKTIITTFAPLLMLGGLLGYARLRTSSLGLPIGLQTGWLAANGLLDELHQNAGLLQQGFIPMAAIVLTAVMVHFLTATPHDDPPSDP
ncbi:MAG: CPBP family glutamic-type intramembrane protease [Verrucomicrobiota bacterium]